VALVALVAVSLASREATVHAARRARPNVVVVMTDDQRADDLSVMHKTRRLLKRRGTTFTNSFVTYSLCCPSRVTLLTGQYAHNHGVGDNDPPHGGYPAFLRKVNAKHTLPVYLHQAGYRTGLVGKLMNSYGVAHPRQIPRGWDYWQALTMGTDHWMYGYTLNANGRLNTHDGRPSDYQTDVLSRRADRFVRRSSHGRRPFFLLLATGAPHEEPVFFDASPHRNPRPAPRDLNRYQHKRPPHPPSFNERLIRDKPPFLHPPRLTSKEKRSLIRLYRSRLESLLAVDDAVKRLARTLRRTGELRNTVIIFTSDNGYLLGEHREHGKELPYEESMRVPLIIRGPGFPHGARRSQLAANVDLAPTIVDVAHAPGRRRMDGTSLVNLARNPAHGRRRDILFERSRSEGRAFTSVRTARYVLTRYAGAKNPRAGSELYDLRRDPYELSNRADSDAYARVRKSLLPRLRALRDCKRGACRAVRGGEPAPRR
jgi:N-acetylglucosamine-6-sulfatase